jgi:hypothetical protein
MAEADRFELEREFYLIFFFVPVWSGRQQMRQSRDAEKFRWCSLKQRVEGRSESESFGSSSSSSSSGGATNKRALLWSSGAVSNRLPVLPSAIIREPSSTSGRASP